jgi:hypothetical protein
MLSIIPVLLFKSILKVPIEIFLIISFSKTLSPDESKGGINKYSLKKRLTMSIQKFSVKINLKK